MGSPKSLHGDDAKVEYRKALWREFLAETLKVHPNRERVREPESRFDEIVARRPTERRILNDWVAAVYMHRQ